MIIISAYILMFDNVEFSKMNVDNFITPFDVIGVFTKSSILSGYHADTPITIKAEAIHKADSHSH